MLVRDLNKMQDASNSQNNDSNEDVKNEGGSKEEDKRLNKDCYQCKLR